ncbi:hypothetical protein EJD96_14375 [Herbaspirillum seropedicae]|uniref:cache domain-containing protein n=1 Tax=Herbaspirillum seropedicae TaxID=964 RepID=UPI0011224D32|nr:cache domain-containing protein [Herbaspirillum seropedicae]QDD65259.1 hypothetical protein EJD96_14375 [Herbaspirillum seropedicae]
MGDTMVVRISLPRMLRLALRVIGVANCLLLFWLCVGMQRQRVEENEIQALRLIESDAIKRISILTSKVTTVLTVLQAVDSTQSGRHHARPLTAPFRKILDNEPMLSGLTVVDEQGGSWGLGKYRKNGWVSVTPRQEDQAFQRLHFTNADGSTGSTELVSLPRLVSPWFQVMTLKDGQILWAPPFTSTVISEPVISAAIKSSHGHVKAYAVHIRLADLQIGGEFDQRASRGNVLLMDRQGRMVTRSRTRSDEEISGLLGSLKDLQLDPFNAMLEQWLKVGKPLRTSFRFDGSGNVSAHVGRVSQLWLGALEFYLMVEIPKTECALICFLKQLPTLLLPGQHAAAASHGDGQT